MPEVSVSTSMPNTVRADALVLGIRTDEDKGDLAEVLDLVGFTGEEGQTLAFPSGGLVEAPMVVAVSLPAEPAPEDLRRAAARGVRAVDSSSTVAVALHPADAGDVVAIAEGVRLGTYRYDAYKSTKASKDKSSVSSVVIVSPLAQQGDVQEAVTQSTTLVEAVNIARDWVNTPPGDLRPPAFAEAISAHARDHVTVSVWDEKRLTQERCGGILGVGRGSDAPPRLVTLTYDPPGATTHLALVGKGITFDSGGLSIKPGASMQTMKMDMAGAAAVAAATVAIARLGLPIRVTTFVCIAENMPSGAATRPGDVLTMRNGSTVEVHNTDAEGRLVLADGLALAVEAAPDHIVDVATLTGACMTALGQRTAGIMANDDDFRDRVFAAATSSGESMWPLPIVEEMRSVVRSASVGDLRQHNPKPYGGALYAAAFLREFVAETAWAHLDIAGPAFNDGSAYDYTPVGGTGASVRTLVQLARDLTT